MPFHLPPEVPPMLRGRGEEPAGGAYTAEGGDASDEVAARGADR